MTQVDVATFIGRYPFHDSPESTVPALLREIDRVGTDIAWVSSLDAIYGRDPAANTRLYAAVEKHAGLQAVPSIHVDTANWSAMLDEALARGVPAVRCDPTLVGMTPDHPVLREILVGCAVRDIPLMMSVRLEDLRQREPHDPATDLPAWAVRQLVRAHSRARLIITHADREFVEQVHFGSTPGEAARILWEINWIWGPPEDHLELLLNTVGNERFTFGTGMPLRIPETSIAKLDLLELDAPARERLTSGNLAAF